MMTIKNALIEAGRKEVAFTNGGTNYTTRVDELPEETLLRIFDYGKRMFNDAVNGAKHQGKDADVAAKEWLDKAKAGQLGTRTGGARLGVYDKALREIVRDYLKAAGWSAKDAVKDAKDPKVGFASMLALQISRGKGVPMAEVEDETILAAMGKNWPKIEAKAKAMVELQSETLDIEI